MKNKSKISKVETDMSNQNIMIIDGEKYILDRVTKKKISGVEHGDKMIWKRFNEKEYIDDLEIVVNAIKNKVSKEHLLKELLKEVDAKSLRRLVKRIKSHKPVQRQDGCLGFKIGDAYVQLVE